MYCTESLISCFFVHYESPPSPAHTLSKHVAPSAPPENVTASLLTSSSFFLEWDPPPIEHWNGVIRNYTISVELLGNATAYNITTNNTEYSFTTLLPFYTFRITVAAVTEPGVGPASPAIDVVLPESGTLIIIDKELLRFVGKVYIIVLHMIFNSTCRPGVLLLRFENHSLVTSKTKPLCCYMYLRP